MRDYAASLCLLLTACEAASETSPEVTNAERAAFISELSLLTYFSQCPDVTPLSLGGERDQITALKTELEVRIIGSPLRKEYEASTKEMARQAAYSNESDCVGTPWPDEAEFINSAHRGFASERQKIATLDAHFKDLLNRTQR